MVLLIWRCVWLPFNTDHFSRYVIVYIGKYYFLALWCYHCCVFSAIEKSTVSLIFISLDVICLVYLTVFRPCLCLWYSIEINFLLCLEHTVLQGIEGICLLSILENFNRISQCSLTIVLFFSGTRIRYMEYLLICWIFLLSPLIFFFLFL